MHAGAPARGSAPGTGDGCAGGRHRGSQKQCGAPLLIHLHPLQGLHGMVRLLLMPLQAPFRLIRTPALLRSRGMLNSNAPLRIGHSSLSDHEPAASERQSAGSRRRRGATPRCWGALSATWRCWRPWPSYRAPRRSSCARWRTWCPGSSTATGPPSAPPAMTTSPARGEEFRLFSLCLP